MEMKDAFSQTEDIKEIENNFVPCSTLSSVSLISLTPDAEKLIAYIARVSNPDNQSNPSYKNLLKYLIRNHHWSPFEMVNMCIEINTTRAISPQILRHRSFSFQEFSQRYCDVNQLKMEKTSKEVFPSIDLRKQDLKNRQNSITNSDSLLLNEKYKEEITHLFNSSLSLYNKMLSDGVAKECARSILPLNTPTKLYMNGTLRSWIHYLQLRSSNGTQKEHADIANDIINNIIKKELPTIYEICFLESNANE